MRSIPDCLSCARKQADRILTLVYGESPTEPQVREIWDKTLAEVQAFLATNPLHLSPAELSYEVLKIIMVNTGNPDPFYALKRETNRAALDLLPRLKQKVEQSRDRLHTAALIAVAGNIIDLGIQETIDIEGTLERILLDGFARSDFERFRDDLHFAESILYIADNAGEIVFDRVLIEVLREEMPQLDLTVSVNQGPILNDALLEDAEEAGIGQFARVIDNGSDLIGTILPRTRDEFQLAFSTADIILSKGQGNFETLEGRPDNIYFVLQAKCKVVAQALGVNHYDAVFIHA